MQEKRKQNSAASASEEAPAAPREALPVLHERDSPSHERAVPPQEATDVLENAAAILQQRFGAQALRKASHLTDGVIPPHIVTGFPELDAATGCRGIPLGDITLLSGRATSGKLTLAYKTLMHAQRSSHEPVRHADDKSQQPTGNTLVAIVDLNQSTDPDYLARAGVDLERSLIIRPQTGPEAVNLMLDLARTQDVRAILVDSLTDLLLMQEANSRSSTNGRSSTGGRLQAVLSQLRTLLRSANCALILIDEVSPPWQRWNGINQSAFVQQSAALHIALEWEDWLFQQQDLVGYRVQARILKSRWARGEPSAALDIRFATAESGNKSQETVIARETW